MRRILYLILFYCVVNSVYAQDNYYYNFTVKDGLPSNITYRAVQDSSDLLWIGTEKGISVYNGYTFKTVDVGYQLESNDVWKLVMDKYQRIWIFTTNSEPVILQNGKTFLLSDLTKRKKDELVTWCSNLNDMSDGARNNYLLLATTLDSAFYLNRKSELVPIDFPESVIADLRNDKVLNSTFRDNDIGLLYKTGKLVTWNYKGIKISEQHEVKLTQPRKIDYSQNMNAGKDHLCIQDGEQLFILRNNHLVKIVEGTNQFSVKNIIGVSTDYIFTKENDRLISINRNDWDNTRVLNENIKNAKSIYEDKEKNIWIFSYDNGIYLLPYLSQNAKIYNKMNGLKYSNITCMNFDKTGKLLIGHNFGASSTVFDNGKFQQLPRNKMIRDYFIFSDSKNNIWNSGVRIYTDKEIKVNSRNDEMSLQFIKKDRCYEIELSSGLKSFCQIDDKYFFGGNKIYQSTSLKNEINFNELKYSGNRIYSMAPSSKNKLFLGTTHGVVSYDIKSGSTKRLKFKNNTSNIRSLAFDKGMLWIASDKEGLIIYDVKNEIAKTILRFKNHTISEIYIDEKSSFAWLSTNKGLYKLTMSSFDKMEIEIEFFSTTNGLPTNEVNCCRTKGNEIYVGTAEGLAIIKDQQEKVNYRPKISVSAVYVNGSAVGKKDEYNLTNRENHFAIEFTAVSFSSLGNIRYEYKLEGIDKNWISSKGRVLEYPNLAPGKYRLLVVGYDAMGHKTSNQIDMTIIIKPAIYKRWWFIILVSLLLLFGLGYLFYSYDKKDRLSKQLTSLKFEALQSQLNSHFIFNALNAIQMYVLRHDTRAVNKYMSQFALLIRSFLDSSRNKSVVLANEIKFIETYISLEELINEDKFDVNIEIDPNLNLKYLIPSNIIQPFVENAILHGLLPLEKKGLLTLRFTQVSKKVIRCEIEDDGVGYKQSKKMKKNKKLNKPSHGLNILKERIAVLQKAHGFKIDLMLIDKSYGKAVESGTLVVINFKNERRT